MFNIGFGELAIICIVLIIAVGPERLPSMMKTVGKTMRTLRQASRDLRASTGIDELLREDFDIYTPPPPRRQAPPPGPTPVHREEALPASTASLPSDAPITTQPDADLGAVPIAPVHVPHVPDAHVEPSLPSDAPVVADQVAPITAPQVAVPITAPQVAAVSPGHAPQPADHATSAEPVPGDQARAPRPRES